MNKKTSQLEKNTCSVRQIWIKFHRENRVGIPADVLSVGSVGPDRLGLMRLWELELIEINRRLQENQIQTAVAHYEVLWEAEAQFHRSPTKMLDFLIHRFN